MSTLIHNTLHSYGRMGEGVIKNPTIRYASRAVLSVTTGVWAIVELSMMARCAYQAYKKLPSSVKVKEDSDLTHLEAQVDRLSGELQSASQEFVQEFPDPVLYKTRDQPEEGQVKDLLQEVKHSIHNEYIDEEKWNTLNQWIESMEKQHPAKAQTYRAEYNEMIAKRSKRIEEKFKAHDKNSSKNLGVETLAPSLQVALDKTEERVKTLMNTLGPLLAQKDLNPIEQGTVRIQLQELEKHIKFMCSHDKERGAQYQDSYQTIEKTSMQRIGKKDNGNAENVYERTHHAIEQLIEEIKKSIASNGKKEEIDLTFRRLNRQINFLECHGKDIKQYKDQYKNLQNQRKSKTE